MYYNHLNDLRDAMIRAAELYKIPNQPQIKMETEKEPEKIPLKKFEVILKNGSVETVSNSTLFHLNSKGFVEFINQPIPCTLGLTMAIYAATEIVSVKEITE